LLSLTEMLRVASATRRVGASAALSRQALPATGLLARQAPLIDRRHEQRDLTSKAALSKMGTLSVDPLASSSTVQGVEYVLTGFDSLVNWARKSSLWPMTFGLA